MTIRVGICDDQPLLRDGLRVQLNLVGDLDVVGEAANGEQAVALARQERPDVLVMDVRMPVLDGIEATRRIVGGPGTENVKVLILTTFDLDEHVYAALSAGASGFLLKDATPEEVVHAVRVVAAGEALLAPTVTARLVREFARRASAGRPRPELLTSLTQREVEVLRLVAAGLVERGARGAARDQPRDREDARQPDPDQARAARSRPARGRRLRGGLGDPRRLIARTSPDVRASALSRPTPARPRLPSFEVEPRTDAANQNGEPPWPESSSTN